MPIYWSDSRDNKVIKVRKCKIKKVLLKFVDVFQEVIGMTESEVEEKIYKKLSTIEKEIADLKHIFFQNMQYIQPKQLVSLKGIGKGADVSEEDIQKAKKSLFKHAGV